MDVSLGTKLSTGILRCEEHPAHSVTYVLRGIFELVLHQYLLLYYLWQDVINCVGGLPVLFPILEQLALVTPDLQASDPAAGSDFITPDVTTPADGDWVILPSSRASGLFYILVCRYCLLYYERWKRENKCIFTFCFRGTPREESGGHLPFGAEAFPPETPNQPGEYALLALCRYTGSPAAEGLCLNLIWHI